MLQYNEIREKKIIIYNNEPWEVIDSHVARTQQRKPQNQVKLKSLISGKTMAATFHASETAEEADIKKREVKFIYHNRNEYWFCAPDNPRDRFQLPDRLIGEAGKFLKANGNVQVLVWENEGEEVNIKISLPIKMEFRVKEAPPAVRGDTSKGGNKFVVLENGATISAPMFINPGDIIRINTETGEYVERV
jgi:elongation factor P